MLTDPEAELGETILPVMLTPPLPANENSPLATTDGGSSVRLGWLAVPSRHSTPGTRRHLDDDGCHIAEHAYVRKSPCAMGARDHPRRLCENPRGRNAPVFASV